MIFSTRSRIIARNDAASTGIQWSRDTLVSRLTQRMTPKTWVQSCLALSCYAVEMPATGSGFDRLCGCKNEFTMTNKSIGLMAAIAIIGISATVFAQAGAKQANLGEGTVMVKGKNYPLKNAVAYETTIDGEEGIAVVLSGPTISSEKINEAKAE